MAKSFGNRQLAFLMGWPRDHGSDIRLNLQFSRNRSWYSDTAFETNQCFVLKKDVSNTLFIYIFFAKKATQRRSLSRNGPSKLRGPQEFALKSLTVEGIGVALGKQSGLCKGPILMPRPTYRNI